MCRAGLSSGRNWREGPGGTGQGPSTSGTGTAAASSFPAGHLPLVPVVSPLASSSGLSEGPHLEMEATGYVGGLVNSEKGIECVSVCTCVCEWCVCVSVYMCM